MGFLSDGGTPVAGASGIQQAAAASRAAVSTSFMAERFNRGKKFPRNLITATFVGSQERYIREDLSLRGL